MFVELCNPMACNQEQCIKIQHGKESTIGNLLRENNYQNSSYPTILMPLNYGSINNTTNTVAQQSKRQGNRKLRLFNLVA